MWFSVEMKHSCASCCAYPESSDEARHVVERKLIGPKGASFPEYTYCILVLGPAPTAKVVDTSLRKQFVHLTAGTILRLETESMIMLVAQEIASQQRICDEGL